MEVQREEPVCSEVGTSEAATSEDTRGKSPSHTIFDNVT